MNIHVYTQLLVSDNQPIREKVKVEDLGATSSDKKHETPFPLPEDTANHPRDLETIDHPPDVREDRECMIPQAHVDRLQCLHNQLVHEINHPDKLASHLYSQKSITQMEMEDVQAEKTRYKQVQELLNIVSKKSQHTFTAFTKALCFNKQRDLAELVANKQLEIGKSYHIYR